MNDYDLKLGMFEVKCAIILAVCVLAIVALASYVSGCSGETSDPVSSPSPTPTEEKPKCPPVLAQACVPGATQQCLGPGACKGAQSCKDDGTGWEPCNCGIAP